MQFGSGNYSVIRDTDHTLIDEALDFLLFIVPEDWDENSGGQTLYLVGFHWDFDILKLKFFLPLFQAAGDESEDGDIEDQLLLTAEPKANHATLIFRDAKA